MTVVAVSLLVLIWRFDSGGGALTFKTSRMRIFLGKHCKVKELTMLRHVEPNSLTVACELKENGSVVVVVPLISSEGQDHDQVLDTRNVLNVTKKKDFD